jgi:hypothetical protein
MTLDLQAFTAWTALAGGALIGAAAALLLWGSGRIAGISGIVGALLRPARGDVAWRVAFVAGLLLAPAAHALWRAVPAPRIDASTATLLVAGLLVGLGRSRVRRRTAAPAADAADRRPPCRRQPALRHRLGLGRLLPRPGASGRGAG